MNLSIIINEIDQVKNWDDSTLDAITYVCTILLAVTALADDFEKQNPRFFFWAKSLVFKIIMVVAILLISFWATSEKNKNVKIDEYNKDQSNQADQNRRDTINNRLIIALTNQSQKHLVTSIDSVQAHIITKTNEGLRLFHLHYDSVQNRVVRLVNDSLKGVTNVYKIGPPEVEIDTIKSQNIRFDEKRMLFLFSNQKDLATNVKIKFYTLRSYLGDYDKFDGSHTFVTFPQLGGKSQQALQDYPNPKRLDYQYYYFFFSIEYTDRFNKPYSLNEIYRIDCKTLHLGRPTGFNYNIILEEFYKAYPECKNW